MERSLSAFVERLLAALDGYDETEAERILDEVLERFGLDEAIALVLMPFLVEVGDRWESGAVSVTQEHFASHLVRSRLTADVEDVMPTEDGPTVLVACAPGERHDIAPLAFSVLRRRAGWQVRYLGADTPMATWPSPASGSNRTSWSSRRLAGRPCLTRHPGCAGSPLSTRSPSPEPGRRVLSRRSSGPRGSTVT